MQLSLNGGIKDGPRFDVTVTRGSTCAHAQSWVGVCQCGSRSARFVRSRSLPNDGTTTTCVAACSPGQLTHTRRLHEPLGEERGPAGAGGGGENGDEVAP